ncbi:ankyrin repeat domain-containing protein [uncultured Brachyspira sp.]|uniref:ankyrin repeat domain-containing protein n=1 Tax=uncultured Brachyspira sp. TaxID=221953 RepID=UPI0027DE462B|nr:ankyrin repeat domain-containing protein [uncultured Brachyspira sp.]
MGANINIKDDKGNTPLIIASYNGHKEIVSMLIKNKANINDRNNEGDTAVMEACKQKNMDIIAILIKNGAKLEIKLNNEF